MLKRHLTFGWVFIVGNVMWDADIGHIHRGVESSPCLLLWMVTNL